MQNRELVDAIQIAKDVWRDVGYDSEEKGLDYNTMEIVTRIPQQSKEITTAVKNTEAKEDLGAGDQGMMFGYATDEADDESYHPITHLLANKLAQRMCEVRKTGEISWLRPDCKTQVNLVLDFLYKIK